MNILKREYKVNDLVIHKNEGLCKIIEIVTMANKEYYKMLIENKKDNTTIYLPISKKDEMLVEVMSKEDADDLLRYMKSLEEKIVESTKERRGDYAKKLASGDKRDLVYIVKYLYLLKQDKDLKNVKLGEQDTITYLKASDMLFDELSVVYGVSRDKVEEYIKNKMENEF